MAGGTTSEFVTAVSDVGLLHSQAEGFSHMFDRITFDPKIMGGVPVYGVCGSR
jgi:hypothetical protein